MSVSTLSQFAREAIPRLERLVRLEEISVPDAARLLRKKPEFIRNNFPIIIHSPRSHHVRMSDVEAYQERRTLKPKGGKPMNDLTRIIRVAYADPPYEGESKQHYGNHKDFAGEVDYAELVRLLAMNFPDGWALSMKQATLRSVLNVCVVELGLKVRIGVWCKRNPTFKKNVNPAYAWEPVIFCGGRKRKPDEDFLLDWIDCPATIQRNDGGKLFVGRKPAKFCYWLFGMLGLNRNDKLTDIYEGTGSVGWAWKCYKEQTSLWEDSDLSGGVEKSQETRWQNGKDIPEGESLTAHKSGSELSPRQTCGSSAPPAQKTFLT